MLGLTVVKWESAQGKIASRLGHDRRVDTRLGGLRGKEVTVKDTAGSHSHFLSLSSVLTVAVTRAPSSCVTAVDGRS